LQRTEGGAIGFHCKILPPLTRVVRPLNLGGDDAAMLSVRVQDWVAIGFLVEQLCKPYLG